jgi:ribosome recycling factor
MVKKLEKEKNYTKDCLSPPKKQVQKERDEKVKYARNVFLNARRPISRAELATKIVTSTTLG